MTSIGVGGIVDYHGVDSDWISQGRGLVDDRGVGVDSTSSGVGGLVYDRCVGVELISRGDGGRVDDRCVDYNQDIRRSNGGPEAVQGDAWPRQRVYSRGQIPRPNLRPNEVRA